VVAVDQETKSRYHLELVAVAAVAGYCVLLSFLLLVGHPSRILVGLEVQGAQAEGLQHLARNLCRDQMQDLMGPAVEVGKVAISFLRTTTGLLVAMVAH
tara:strand:+ start:212 stop:508 length:297 start_codon:yes stop_codon:yes gene_type:complete